MGILIAFFLIVLSSYFLYKSCANFDRNSKIIGKNLKQGIRGATINAISSSLPEFFTALFFLFILRDVDGLTTGLSTVLGSAVFNILLIPAIVIYILVKKKHNLLINKKLILRDAGVLLISQISLLIFLVIDRNITRIESFILFSIYIIYIIILSRGGVFKLNFKDKEAYKSRRKLAWKNILLSILKISLWCLLLVYASNLLHFGDFPKVLSFLNFEGLFQNIMFVGLLFAAAASSVPDLFISIFDARTGHVDDSLANPIASNLFDICIAFGLSILFYTFFYGTVTFNDTAIFRDIYSLILIMIIITVLFLISIVLSKKYNIYHSIFFLLLFIVFIFSLFDLDLVYKYISY